MLQMINDIPGPVLCDAWWIGDSIFHRQKSTTAKILLFSHPMNWTKHHVDGLVQKCSNFSVLVMDLL